tara:strand:- start:53 stop:322 length:270 start_codon:yes stop_codon:yes gene_type:complete
MSDKIHKRRSVNYKKALTGAIHNGDFEGIIKNIMLLAVKHNDEVNWKMGPRTFMELCTVLLKFRQEFGNSDEMEQILQVLEGGQSGQDI